MRSQRALLARDLEGMERGTNEQIRLQQVLAMLLASAQAADGGPGDRGRGSSQFISGQAISSEPKRGFDPDATLIAAAHRVLHLGRVQAALLTRAQLRLKWISYLAAGPQTTYEPPVLPRPIGKSEKV